MFNELRRNHVTLIIANIFKPINQLLDLTILVDDGFALIFNYIYAKFQEDYFKMNHKEVINILTFTFLIYICWDA